MHDKVMSIESGFEPLMVTIAQTERLTGESRSQIYVRLGRGDYEGVKSGSRTFIVYTSLNRWMASLPPAKVKASRSRPYPHAAPK